MEAYKQMEKYIYSTSHITGTANNLILNKMLLLIL